MWLVEIYLTFEEGSDLRKLAYKASTELRKLDHVNEADMLATFGESTLMYSMTVDIDDQAEAMGIALVAMRAALHGAGQPTPHWDAQVEEAFSRSKVVSEPVPV